MSRSRSVGLLAACGLVFGMALGTHQAEARGVPVEAASKKQKAEAQKEYEEGKRAFDQKNLELALERFRKSYDIVASPNSHLMIARTLVELGRDAEAYDEYGGVIEEAKSAADAERYAKTLESAEGERRVLRGRLALMTVNVDAMLTANGSPIPSHRWGQPIAVKPGTVALELKSESGVLARQQVEAPAGGQVTVSIATPAPSAPPPPPATVSCPPVESRGPEPPRGISPSALGWVFAGVGVVGWASFAAFGVLNNSKFDELQERCPGNLCPESLASDVESGRRYQTYANVGLVVGAVGIGTAIVLWLASPGSTDKAERVRSRLALSTSESSVSGRF